MTSRRKFLLGLIVLAVMGVACIVLAIVRKHARAYLLRPHTPRPMFHEWALTDWGAGWCVDMPVKDQHGTWMYCDRTLNLVVVLATACSKGQLDRHRFEPDHAILLAGTQHETTVRPMQNSLYIVVFPSREVSVFALDDDTARRIYRRVKIDLECPADILHALPALCHGPDQEKLTAFLRTCAEAPDAVQPRQSRAETRNIAQEEREP